ncbi:hypothetical protein Syn7803US13_47 [Synechococcus phage ACG-2014f]|uniref:Uncharacterized protein n=5 Tax=Atlauavirus TaxID=2733092 RepID=A0A0E3HMX4_9CAUD|nr:hypothetical protein AAJ63_gp047 [Synechococcus phage ACG-2014f]YP_009778201.1 hypothetical protein HOQ61_gp047 [Synechococcus phage ACG-2014f_Syn7803C7]YP_009778488.1 hypothetical protein HOQ62_gp048 [Synechococcus phage ACG-2014f_Syn7803C8]YP_009778774.1 hypothetical protein HOQ63_gp047 [Synechococcus phage ACG-2014f_Syn7803US26]AIX16572.1 hypothetical protein Syn7803C58_47 [Synechococcus phage ACG-2014f]AIX18346.1 hypothetical protein Syn7803C6_47 [Synechococcus phage ACG-2014f]AIX19938
MDNIYGREYHRHAVDYALMIGELEGTYTHLKRMSYFEDAAILEEMKKRYYKIYFRTLREEREKAEN